MNKVEQALCDVKEVALHTKLPGHKWEDNARILAAEVVRLEQKVDKLDKELQEEMGFRS